MNGSKTVLTIMTGAALLWLGATQAFAETKICIGLTAFNEIVPVLIAKEEGFFAKHGIEAEIQIIPLNSTMPAALQSDSIQIAGVTSSVFIQAVDGGLDLVALAGGSYGTKTDTNIGLLVKTGSDIKSPQDLVGKKIGTPGLGAALHVLTRKWLLDQGVDYNKVTFIETPFPQQNDFLKGGSVDAVITVEPFLNRITAAGTGTLLAHTSAGLPEGLPAFVYGTTREWAAGHAEAVKGFRAALAEGIAFANDHLDQARADFGKYVKLPPPVLAQLTFLHMTPNLKPEQLQLWIDIMNQEKMLKTQVDVGKIIVP